MNDTLDKINVCVVLFNLESFSKNYTVIKITFYISKFIKFLKILNNSRYLYNYHY